MKFSELPDRNANAIAGFYLKVAEIKADESQQLAQAGLRLLVLGNGAGIVILATFMGVIVENGQELSGLITPLVWFLVGATVAAFIYIPLIAVSSNAANHIGQSVEEFFKDDIELENLQGYGLSKGGTRIVTGLLLFSLLCFIVGVILCVGALQYRS